MKGIAYQPKTVAVMSVENHLVNDDDALYDVASTSGDEFVRAVQEGQVALVHAHQSGDASPTSAPSIRGWRTIEAERSPGCAVPGDRALQPLVQPDRRLPAGQGGEASRSTTKVDLAVGAPPAHVGLHVGPGRSGGSARWSRGWRAGTPPPALKAWSQAPARPWRFVGAVERVGESAGVDGVLDGEVGAPACRRWIGRRLAGERRRRPPGHQARAAVAAAVEVGEARDGDRQPVGVPAGSARSGRSRPR